MVPHLCVDATCPHLRTRTHQAMEIRPAVWNTMLKHRAHTTKDAEASYVWQGASGRDQPARASVPEHGGGSLVFQARRVAVVRV